MLQCATVTYSNLAAPNLAQLNKATESPHKHKHVRASKRCGHQFAFQTVICTGSARRSRISTPLQCGCSQSPLQVFSLMILIHCVHAPFSQNKQTSNYSILLDTTAAILSSLTVYVYCTNSNHPKLYPTVPPVFYPHAAVQGAPELRLMMAKV
jgi:hypothetical protein